MRKKKKRELKNLTNDVCLYGLWQSASEIDNGLGRLSTDNTERQTLESQLKLNKMFLSKHTLTKRYLLYPQSNLMQNMQNTHLTH